MYWLKALFILLNFDNGRFSHTRFWSNIAYSVSTFIILKVTLLGNLTEEMFFIYLGVVGAHASVSKLISARYGKGSDEDFRPLASQKTPE